MIGYIGSAGIVVGIIILYYLISFDPELDPFLREGKAPNRDPSLPFRVNPIDTIIYMSGRLGEAFFQNDTTITPVAKKRKHSAELGAAYLKVCEPLGHFAVVLLRRGI